MEKSTDTTKTGETTPLAPKAVEPMSLPSAAVELLGEDHPILKTGVEALRAFGDDISRANAAQLLTMWQHNSELSDREREAILAYFPETTEADVSAESVDLVLRLDAKFRDLERRERKALATGWVWGLNARMDGQRTHAFTVTRDPEVAGKFNWLCACGWVTIQYPEGEHQDPVNLRLMDHFRAATDIDVRTARALVVEDCSCEPEAGAHWHLMYLRRKVSSVEKITGVVVDSIGGTGRIELLCWTMTEAGVASAMTWVGRHGAKWDDGTAVTTDELDRRTAGWLS